MMNPFSLEDKLIIVTGASSGIGRQDGGHSGIDRPG